jgi:hypothetical protein
MRKTFALSLLAATLAILPSPYAHAFGVTSLSEGFEDITNLAGKGWGFDNNSSPGPATTTATANWLQTIPSVGVDPFTGLGTGINSQSGPSNSAIAVSTDSTKGGSGSQVGVGEVNNWLITPELDFSLGGVFSFFTSTLLNQFTYAQYLEVRASTNGSSINVGSTSSDVGDFSLIEATVGSLSASGSYSGLSSDSAYQKVSFNIAPTGGSGRIAFRYFAPNGGVNGTQGGVIAIDTVSYEAAPEPATASAFSGFAVLGLVGFFKRKRSLITP